MTKGRPFPTVRDTWRALAAMPRGDNTLAGVNPAARESPATPSRDPAGNGGGLNTGKWQRPVTYTFEIST